MTGVQTCALPISEQGAAVLELLESRRADYLAGRDAGVDADEVMAKARAMLR